jgi:hypothetical protein
MDINVQCGVLAVMAADARARRDWRAVEVLRAAVYDLYYFRGGYSFHAANQLTNQMIERCFAEADMLL